MDEKDMGCEVLQNYNFSFADKFDIEDIETNRHLYLNSEIDENVINQIAYHILRYNRLDKGVPVEDRKPVVLYINTPGGSVVDGYGLIDSILCSRTPVYTVNLGECASMGFLVFIAGHKRFSMPHAEFLMHEGVTGAFDNISKAKERIDFEAGELEQMTKEHVLSRTNISDELYRDKYKCEWYFLPKEAKELGVTDFIIGQDCELNEVI